MIVDSCLIHYYIGQSLLSHFDTQLSKWRRHVFRNSSIDPVECINYSKRCLSFLRQYIVFKNTLNKQFLTYQTPLVCIIAANVSWHGGIKQNSLTLSSCLLFWQSFHLPDLRQRLMQQITRKNSQIQAHTSHKSTDKLLPLMQLPAADFPCLQHNTRICFMRMSVSVCVYVPSFIFESLCASFPPSSPLNAVYAQHCRLCCGCLRHANYLAA